MASGVSGAPVFLWPATAIFGFSAASRSSAAIQLSRLSGVDVADEHMALVVEHVAADDEVDRWNVQRGAVDGVCPALLDDVDLVSLKR